MTVQLKRNDTKDTISYTVTNLDGSIVNLTGASVKFVMGKNKTLITNAAATVINAATGQVSYTLTDSDTLLAGNFNAEFEVTYSNGKVKSYPSDGYIMVKIQANIDKNQSTYLADQIAYRVSDIQILKNSVQSQLDQFAKGATNAETSQARVEKDGTVNTTLKARLDKKEDKFASDINSLSSQMAQTAKQSDIDLLNKITGCYKTFKKLMDKLTIKGVCIGDSMTYGTMGTGGRTVNPYPQILQDRLRYLYDYADITIVNNGVAGTDSMHGKNNFQQYVLNQSPDFVVIMYGINDSNSDVSVESYISNLNYMITEAKKTNIEVILCSPTQAFTNLNRNEIAVYRKAVSALANQANVTFVDTWAMGEEIYEDGSILPNLIGDNTHYEDSTYNYLADVILANSFVPATFLKTNRQKEVVIPALSNNVLNNASSWYKNAPQIETGGFIFLDATKPTEWVKVPIYVRSDDYILYLVHMSHTSHGSVQIENNGVVASTINGAKEGTVVEGVRTEICKLTHGLNIVTLKASSITGGNGQFTVEGFHIVKNPFIPSIVTGGQTDVTTEILKPILSKFRINTPTALGVGQERVVLPLDTKQRFRLEKGKTLIMEFEQMSDGIAGIGWFMNKKYATASTYDHAYDLRLYNNQVLFAHNNSTIVQPATTTPYGTKHKVRIEHKYDGVIKVYVNGSLVIDLINTKASSGYLYTMITLGATYLEITNLNIGYI